MMPRLVWWFFVSIACSLASPNDEATKPRACNARDICASTKAITCQPESVILVDQVYPESRGNRTCDFSTTLRDRCNYMTSCELRLDRACCTADTPALRLRYFCINDSAIDNICHQSPKEPIPATVRHIHPIINQSPSTSGVTKTKPKPPFCQWKIPIPENRSVFFMISQLSNPSGNCLGTSSLLIQYDVADKKRPKYVRGVPTCVKKRRHPFKLERGTPHVLVWFTPINYLEQLWLSFELVDDPKWGITTYVPPNATSCQETTVTETETEIETETTPTRETPGGAEISAGPAGVVVERDTWSSERMALIAGLAAVCTIAAFFLIVSIILFCKLHRLRFLSKGFSRLRKMPGGGFDVVNTRQTSGKGDDIVCSRKHDDYPTHGDYRKCETPVYSVARRQSTEADDNFLRHLEMSTPTYAVPYVNIRDDPASRTIVKENGAEKHCTQKPPPVHVALTDEMFKGGKGSPDDFSSRDWIIPGDDVIDITTCAGSDEIIPGYYRQSGTVENALYDSPGDDEDAL